MRNVRLTVAVLALSAVSAPAFAANPPTVATANVPIAQPAIVHPVYTPHPLPQVTTGRYILRLRLASVNGTAVQAFAVRAIPVVVGAKDGKVGFGGKYGPQITGSITNGVVNASGVSPGGVSVALNGGTQGHFRMGKGTVSLDGEYVLDPVGTNGGGVIGETRVGVGTTSGFSSMTSGWNTGTSATGVGGSTTVAGNNYASGMTGVGSTQSNNFATNSAAVNGSNGVGMGNQGPNLGGTAASGWFSDDDDPSPQTKINPSTAGNPMGSTGSGTDSSAKLSTYGSGSTSGSSTSSSWDWSHPVDSAVRWWNGTNITGGGGGKKEDNPMDDGSHNAGTSGSGLNFGHFPTVGNDKGSNASGSGTLNRPTPGGDNPFDVSGPGDVLNANKLINGASDPAIAH